MGQRRQGIPKSVRDGVLAEYNHLCAVCAQPNPQVHHIDGDPSNNEPLNLLPLCPNHHLTDQHNPTRRIDVGIIRLFRRHRDPSILSPQFEPLYERLRFLDELNPDVTANLGLKACANELVEFLAVLEMGEFYSGRVKKLTVQRVMPRSVVPGVSNADFARWQQSQGAAYARTLAANREEILKLVVEQLRYQGWESPFGI